SRSAEKVSPARRFSHRDPPGCRRHDRRCKSRNRGTDRGEGRRKTMKIRRGFALLLLLAPSAIACRDTPEAKAAQVRALQAERRQELARRIAAADSNPTNTAPLAKWLVQAELREISGLALKANGNVLAHNDEVA